MSDETIESIVLSFPKSGRTWLRVMLDNLGVSLKYTHSGGAHRRGFHLQSLSFNRANLHKGKIIFMHRDPRDTVVSGFFELTRRAGHGDLPMRSFIRDPRHGIEKIVHFNLGWLSSLQGQPDVHVLSYEDLSAHTFREMSAVLRFIGRPEAPLLRRVIEECRFEKMQKLEREGFFAKQYGKKLMPRNLGDPDTFKVRRGIVGGYVDYLEDDDIAWCNAVLVRFDYEASVKRLRSTSGLS